MISMALALGLVLGSDSLAPVSLQGLSFKAPSSWVKEAPDENSMEWSAPDEAAKLAISVYVNDKLQPASGCVKKMLDAVGKEGFEPLSIGAQPASKKITTDFVGEANDAKTDANKVTTTTVLGCNGKIRWLITWSAKTAEGARLGPIYKRIIESVSYGK
jgi:hypothetical protein